jgi:hypothetical protein
MQTVINSLFIMLADEENKTWIKFCFFEFKVIKKLYSSKNIKI